MISSHFISLSIYIYTHVYISQISIITMINTDISILVYQFIYIYIMLDHTHDNLFEISILTHQLYQHFFSESRSSASSAPRPRCPLPPQWKPALDIYGRGRQRRICCGAFGDFLSEHPDDSGLCDLNLWLFSWGKSWLAWGFAPSYGDFTVS